MVGMERTMERRGKGLVVVVVAVACLPAPSLLFSLPLLLALPSITGRTPVAFSENPVKRVGQL